MSKIETKQYADGTIATGVAPLPDQSPAEQVAADHQCCGKCDKPAESNDLTADDYRAAIRDLASRLQTADLVIAVLLHKAGGSVALVDADGEAVIGKNVVQESDAESKTITFRLVDAPVEVVQ